MLAYSSDLNKEGTIYDGPSFVDVTKEEVIAIYDKWEEEVRVIVQVISVIRLIKSFFYTFFVVDLKAHGEAFSMGYTCNKPS